MFGKGDDCISITHVAMQFSSKKDARGFYSEYIERMEFTIQTESSKRLTPYGPIDRKYLAKCIFLPLNSCIFFSSRTLNF